MLDPFRSARIGSAAIKNIVFYSRGRSARIALDRLGSDCSAVIVLDRIGSDRI